MTPKQFIANRKEMNEALGFYLELRSHLKGLNNRIHHGNSEKDRAQAYVTRAYVFGAMNRTRARLKRAIKLVENGLIWLKLEKSRVSSI